jgi:hypothetical protein
VHCCLAVKLLGFLFELIDLLVQSRTGHELEVINFLGQACSYGSSYVLSCVLIFVAHGWTIKFSDIDNFEFFLPISILIGIFKFVLLGIGRIDRHDVDINHRYDSAIGWFLVVF